MDDNDTTNIRKLFNMGMVCITVLVCCYIMVNSAPVESSGEFCIKGNFEINASGDIISIDEICGEYSASMPSFMIDRYYGWITDLEN